MSVLTLSRKSSDWNSADKVKVLFDQGSTNLEKMRALVSDRGPINERSDAFGKEAMSLMGVIAKLQQTSVAPAVKRAADGLVSGFIAAPPLPPWTAAESAPARPAGYPISCRPPPTA